MPQTAIYARKSTESEDRQILSIDSQVSELRRFALGLGLTVGHVLKESKSAKTPGRPVFSQLLTMVNKGQIDQVICWKLDRLARNPVDGGAVIWAMEEGRLEHIYTPQRTFDNTGNDKFWMQLEFGMAKKYVDDLSDNVKRGLRAKLEQGWLPGRPPIGYLNDRNKRTVVPDPERFDLVKQMWDMMLSGGYGPRDIQKIAAGRLGLRTRQTKWGGGGPLGLSAVYRLFQQPFYYGAILRSDVLHPGLHKPMISKGEFDRVQAMLGLRSQPRPQRYKFAYTGMIKCGECGSSVTAENKVQRHGHRYVYYHCTKRKAGRDCSQGVIEVRDLDRQIAAFLDSITVSPKIVEWVSWVLRDVHADEIRQEAARRDALRRRLDACSKELAELTNIRIRGLIADEEYVAKKNELEGERIRLRELLNDNHGREDSVNDMVVETFRFAETARARFEKGSTDDKRAVLRYTGSNLVLLDGILRIQPQKPLFFIQRALGGPALQMAAFEPANRGELQRKKTTQSDAFRVWYRLVEDVRTSVMQEQMRAFRMAINPA